MPRAGVVDLAVVGVGSVGSAVLHHAAKAGVSAVGIEQFAVPNERASYSGRTRIHRLVYPEGDVYARLAKRAGRLWSELERESGGRLFRETGSIDAFPTGDPAFGAALSAAAVHEIAVEHLTGAAASARWPGYRFPPDYNVLFQAEGGVLEAREIVRAQARLALRGGTRIVSGARAGSWKREYGAIAVTTNKGTIRARQLVLTAGPWLGPVLPSQPTVPLRVERQLMTWFRGPAGGRFDPDSFPVSNVRTPDGAKFACTPRLDDDGVKVVKDHHLREVVDPSLLDDHTNERDLAVGSGFAKTYLDSSSLVAGRRKTCMYATSPDGHFVIDFVDGNRDGVFVSACAGHGFKFAPVLAELVLNALEHGQMPPELAAFRAQRFAATGPAPEADPALSSMLARGD